MTDAFFELRSARDVLQKAEREFIRLQSDFNIDTVFNFFVTAYHIQDYVRVANVAPQQALDTFLSDSDLKDCRDLCDKGKHLRLTKRTDPETHIYSGSMNGAPLNTLSINAGSKWVLFTGSREVEVEWLAERVVVKWRGFLTQHGL
jgi:hypothetical protein